MSLVSSSLDFRSNTSKTLHKDIQNASAVFGYSPIEEEPEKSNESSIQPKRKRCAICHFFKDKKLRISVLHVQDLFVTNIL